jgi:hypothetical protein
MTRQKTENVHIKKSVPARGDSKSPEETVSTGIFADRFPPNESNASIFEFSS